MKLYYSLTNDIKMDEDKQITGGTAVELTKAGELSEALKNVSVTFLAYKQQVSMLMLTYFTPF